MRHVHRPVRHRRHGRGRDRKRHHRLLRRRRRACDRRGNLRAVCRGRPRKRARPRGRQQLSEGALRHAHRHGAGKRRAFGGARRTGTHVLHKLAGDGRTVRVRRGVRFHACGGAHHIRNDRSRAAARRGDQRNRGRPHRRRRAPHSHPDRRQGDRRRQGHGQRRRAGHGHIQHHLFRRHAAHISYQRRPLSVRPLGRGRTAARQRHRDGRILHAGRRTHYLHRRLQDGGGGHTHHRARHGPHLCGRRLLCLRPQPA